MSRSTFSVLFYANKSKVKELVRLQGKNMIRYQDTYAEQMARLPEAEANKLSVRLELLADFYAGVWAHHDNKRFGSLEDGDIEEAIRCAQVIGDDYLQKKARGTQGEILRLHTDYTIAHAFDIAGRSE